MNSTPRFLMSGTLALAGATATLLLAGCQTGAGAGWLKAPWGPVTEAGAKAISAEAYVYGYPLVTMDTTRQVMTNVSKPDPAKLRAPMAQFSNARDYPTAASKDVTAPNIDTLYATAWVEVGAEPWVLHIPKMGDRYYLFPMLDAWSNVFADPGQRLGVKGGDFAITGPDWKGTLPAGVQEIKAPTSLVWILGRIYCTGTPADYQAVHQLQDQLSLTPLSAWGKAYTPPAEVPINPAMEMKLPPRDQVNAMDAGAFFNRLALLMKDNRPAAADAPILARMAKLGILPGQPFDPKKLDPAVARGLEAGRLAGQEQIGTAIGKMGKTVNGWQITFTGEYGADYVFRAAVARVGLGANRALDTCYPVAMVDADGQPLTGANRYVWHFASKAELPPVAGFWSLTLYDANWFFVDNPLNRQTLSQRNEFKTNADGSLDLYVQKDSPGAGREANWLPAPAGQFVLCLRLYWPRAAFLNGKWAPPVVKKVP